MRLNRSVPPCVVIPVLIYPDPSAAADWLSKAFGFTVRLRIANHRIQMKAGEGCFTIAEGNVAPNNSHTVQVRIEDRDFYGHRWDFTETITDVAPEEWSDGAFHLE
jgi:hypothetical protein